MIPDQINRNLDWRPGGLMARAWALNLPPPGINKINDWSGIPLASQRLHPDDESPVENQDFFKNYEFLIRRNLSNSF